MAAVDVQVSRRDWPSASTGRWLGRRLALVAGTCLVAGDAILVLGAFLLAYWVRFIAPDLEATALGLNEYARMGAIVSLVTVVLFALHDFYDLDRPRPWLERELHIVQPKLVVVMGAEALAFLNALDFPLARPLEPTIGELQHFTPTTQALVAPDIDASLDEQPAKTAFWNAFKQLGPWWAELPPY